MTSNENELNDTSLRLESGVTAAGTSWREVFKKIYPLSHELSIEVRLFFVGNASTPETSRLDMQLFSLENEVVSDDVVQPILNEVGPLVVVHKPLGVSVRNFEPQYISVLTDIYQGLGFESFVAHPSNGNPAFTAAARHFSLSTSASNNCAP